MADSEDLGVLEEECPRCGARLRPSELRSGVIVMRCPDCRQVVI